MKTTLQMNRKGDFIVSQSQASEHQCVQQGHKHYYYECKILLEQPSLDSRGFIADHEEVNSIIQDYIKGGSIPSCEVLAQGIAKTVSEYLISKDIRHTSVYVKLSGNVSWQSKAFMEAWATPEEGDWINAPKQEEAPENKGPRFRILSLDEIEPMIKVVDSVMWYLKDDTYETKGYLNAFDRQYMEARELTAEEVERYLRDVEKGGEIYTYLPFPTESRNIPHWAIVPVTDTTEAVPEEAPKVLRYLTIAEIQANPLLEESTDNGSVMYRSKELLGRAKVHGSTYAGDIEKVAGELLAEEEIRNYNKAVDSDYVYFYSRTGVGQLPRWLVTNAPLPGAEASTKVEETPKKKWRVRTKWEFDNDSDIRLASDEVSYLSNTGNNQFDKIMFGFFGHELPGDLGEEIMKLEAWSNGIAGPDDLYVGDYAWSRFRWTPWMITDKPLPVKKYRIRKYEDLLADTENIFVDEDGDLMAVDRRKGHTYYTKNNKDIIGGRVLTDEEKKELDKTGEVSSST